MILGALSFISRGWLSFSILLIVTFVQDFTCLDIIKRHRESVLGTRCSLRRGRVADTQGLSIVLDKDPLGLLEGHMDAYRIMPFNLLFGWDLPDQRSPRRRRHGSATVQIEAGYVYHILSLPKPSVSGLTISLSLLSRTLVKSQFSGSSLDTVNCCQMVASWFDSFALPFVSHLMGTAEPSPQFCSSRWSWKYNLVLFFFCASQYQPLGMYNRIHLASDSNAECPLPLPHFPNPNTKLSGVPRHDPRRGVRLAKTCTRSRSMPQKPPRQFPSQGRRP